MLLRDAQSEYDQQLFRVRQALEKVVETHANHMGHLKAFMEAQMAFHVECQAHLGDLQRFGPNM